MRSKSVVIIATAIVAALAGTATAAQPFGPWRGAQKIDEMAGNSPELNTPDMDGCPIQSPDGLSLYMASNRPGGQGLLDIWVARRPHRHAPGVRRRTLASRSTRPRTTSARRRSAGAGSSS